MIPMPVLFVAHGAPTYALEPGLAGAGLVRLGERLPRPKAVLVLSPHWISREPRITGAARPETIHDFGGFPDELYRLQYPAPGAPALAAALATWLREAGYRAELDKGRGLDHGAWVPLRFLYPEADVPVLQLSMPAWLDPASSWALGEALRPLRGQGILIVASGSLTHNLYEFRQGVTAPADYALAFESWAREAVRRHDKAALLDYLNAPHGRRAHPTPDHYLPLLMAAGAASPDGEVEVLEGDMRYGMLSMESYLFG
ncbi:dioxygenase family protein [Zobellella denitrificans]|jgi:4,5-DOPA dioxygenase extradiol|uniref:Aromatic ring-opening dioxygenase LigB n=1 Tax=Zobellella denitrificans TaxID=347534 RepID=A0A291HMI7_9GAMM|nr:class III extradiol ring-cleavage dioxygenase [Zobellella denitrificans]ATG73301.1 aromatic ring-opening dioxygenase LigB [Zobellella denitrificans]